MLHPESDPVTYRTAETYRIDSVTHGLVNCTQQWLYKAFRFVGGTFTCLGLFTAPGDVPREDLWRYVAVRDTAPGDTFEVMTTTKEIPTCE